MANIFSQMFSQFGPAPAQRADQGGGEYTGFIPEVYEGDDTYIPISRTMAERDAAANKLAIQQRTLARRKAELKAAETTQASVATVTPPTGLSVLTGKPPVTVHDSDGSTPYVPRVATPTIADATVTPGATSTDTSWLPMDIAKKAGGLVPEAMWDYGFGIYDKIMASVQRDFDQGNGALDPTSRNNYIQQLIDKGANDETIARLMDEYMPAGESIAKLLAGLPTSTKIADTVDAVTSGYNKFGVWVGDKADILTGQQAKTDALLAPNVITPPADSNNGYTFRRGLIEDEAAVRAGEFKPWTPQDFQPDQGRNTSGASLTSSQLAEIVKHHTWANPTADEEGIGGGGAGAPVGPGLYPGSSEVEIPVTAAEPVVVETGASQNNIGETGGDEGAMVSALKGTGEVVKDNWKVLTAAGLAADVARRRHNTVKIPTPLAKLKAQLKTAPDGPGRKQILREMKDLRKQRWAKLIPKWVTKPRVMAAAGVILIGAAAFEKAFASEDTKGDLEDYIVDALEKDNNLLSTALQMTDPISMMAGGTGLAGPGSDMIPEGDQPPQTDFRDKDSPYHESKRPPLHRPGSAGEAFSSMMTPDNMVGPSGIADYWKNKMGSLF